MLLGVHGSIPAWASIDLANAVLYGSFALSMERRAKGAARSRYGAWSA